jgi:hypothetical protein
LRVKAPISRFSRTLISPNRRRASGTEPTPRRTICGVGRPVIGWPSKRTTPEVGFTRPRMIFMVVDLPLALPPSRQTIWPRPTASEKSKWTCTGP